jgi:hypothetical protein
MTNDKASPIGLVRDAIVIIGLVTLMAMTIWIGVNVAKMHWLYKHEFDYRFQFYDYNGYFPGMGAIAPMGAPVGPVFM